MTLTRLVERAIKRAAGQLPEETVSETYQIDVVLYQEGDHWIAQGLQFDITAQAKTPTELPQRFMKAMASEVVVALELGEEPLASVPAAPAKFWQMFNRSTATLTITEPPAFRVANRPITTPRIVPRMKMAEAAAAC